jgi:hypothetical protein
MWSEADAKCIRTFKQEAQLLHITENNLQNYSTTEAQGTNKFASAIQKPLDQKTKCELHNLLTEVYCNRLSSSTARIF